MKCNFLAEYEESYLYILPFSVDCKSKSRKLRKVCSFKHAQNSINDNEKKMKKCTFLAKYEKLCILPFRPYFRVLWTYKYKNITSSLEIQ